MGVLRVRGRRPALSLSKVPDEEEGECRHENGRGHCHLHSPRVHVFRARFLFWRLLTRVVHRVSGLIVALLFAIHFNPVMHLQRWKITSVSNRSFLLTAYIHPDLEGCYFGESWKNFDESWKNLVNLGHYPGWKIPLNLQDLRRIVTRTSYQDVLPRFLPRFFQDLTRTYKINKLLSPG